MVIRVVLWDIDGTLTDDQLHKQKHRFLAAQASYDLSEQEGVELNGISDSKTYEYLIRKSEHFAKCYPTVEAYLTACQHFFETNAADRQSEYRIRSRPGATELVGKLAINEIQQACVTSAPEWQAKLNLKALQVGKHMSFIQTLEERIKPKPFPDLYELAFEKMVDIIPDLKKSEIIVIEDSLSGVTAANNAGLQVIHCRMKESAPTSNMTSLHAFHFDEVKKLMIDKFNMTFLKQISDQNRHVENNLSSFSHFAGSSVLFSPALLKSPDAVVQDVNFSMPAKPSL